MRISNIEFSVDLEDILNTFRDSLHSNGISLINDIRPTGDENVMITCPYHKNGHEHKPSAGVKKSNGIFHCFTCGETHDLAEVISNCFGRNDGGAYGWNWLLKNFITIEVDTRGEIELDFSRDNYSGNRLDTASISADTFVTEDELDSYRYYHPYWEKRGIVDDDIIELFDLGYDRKAQSITFPIRDKEGHCLFIARRNVHTKFFNYPKGVQKPLYGLYELYNNDVGSILDAGDIIVCESMIDCILLWQEGHFAVALNGLGNKLQMRQLIDLPCRHLILATDNDEAGYKARNKIRANVKGKIFSEIDFPDNIKDIGDCTKSEIEHILDWEVFV